MTETVKRNANIEVIPSYWNNPRFLPSWTKFIPVVQGVRNVSYLVSKWNDLSSDAFELSLTVVRFLSRTMMPELRVDVSGLL